MVSIGAFFDSTRSVNVLHFVDYSRLSIITIAFIIITCTTFWRPFLCFFKRSFFRKFCPFVPTCMLNQRVLFKESLRTLWLNRCVLVRPHHFLQQKICLFITSFNLPKNSFALHFSFCLHFRGITKIEIHKNFTLLSIYLTKNQIELFWRPDFFL